MGGNVACMGQIKNACKILIKKLMRRGQLEDLSIYGKKRQGKAIPMLNSLSTMS
jgi:hypothetical protein